MATFELCSHIFLATKDESKEMTGILRYQFFLCYGAGFAALWYSAWAKRSSLPSSREIDVAILLAPLGVVLLIGATLAGRVAYGVATFESHPDAAVKLELEVQEAKIELKKRGIIK
jgi:hypothetical protein